MKLQAHGGASQRESSAAPAPRQTAEQPPKKEETSCNVHEHNWQDKVPPLVSDERKDRQRTAMPISLSYTSFTLNSTHFSLFKKERGCERPAGASEASTGSELVSFFLKKREMSAKVPSATLQACAPIRRQAVVRKKRSNTFCTKLASRCTVCSFASFSWPKATQQDCTAALKFVSDLLLFTSSSSSSSGTRGGEKDNHEEEKPHKNFFTPTRRWKHVDRGLLSFSSS